MPDEISEVILMTSRRKPLPVLEKVDSLVDKDIDSMYL
jgi:hypothetical protein